MTRQLTTAALTAAFLVAFIPSSQAQLTFPGGTRPGDPGTQRATTVKSSKSNTSDRAATPRQGKKSVARTTTVKSSKSNTSDRIGETKPGKKSNARATTVKSSKSNSSD